MTNYLDHQETGEDFTSASASTFSIHFETESPFDWEYHGNRPSKSPFAYHNTVLDVPGEDQALNESIFDNNNAGGSFVDNLALQEENAMMNDGKRNLQSLAYPAAIVRRLPIPESTPDNFEMPLMYPQDNQGILEGHDLSPVTIFKQAVNLGKGAPPYALEHDIECDAPTEPPAIVTPKTKKASVDFEPATLLQLRQYDVEGASEATIPPPQEDCTVPLKDSLERESKRLKLDYIPVAEVDVPLDYTSQKSTIGHQVWRRDDVRGPRRLVSVAEAKELIKKHKEELIKLGYTREAVFLVKEGNKRAQNGSPLYVWNRNGKDFHYRKASIAAIQSAVNQKSGNTPSKRQSLAEVIRQCEGNLSALDKSQMETAANAAVLHTTLRALKKEPFCGKEFSSMLPIEKVREKSLINMLTRMMKELEASTPQENTRAPVKDTDK